MSHLQERFVDRSITQEVSRYPFNVKEVVIAGDLGPCGGVNMAIEGMDKILTMVNGREPVYVNNSPVHNKLIVEEFIKRGLVIEPDIENIPDRAIWISSAHGANLNILERAKEKEAYIVSLECQLVTKVKREAYRAEKKGEYLIYLGAENHPEPKAVMSILQNPSHGTFVDIKSDLSKINVPLGIPIKVLNQTTLSTRGIIKNVEQIRNSNPKAEIPNPMGICYATDNRQNSIYGIFSDPKKPVDFLIVVGSQSSHNSQELRNIGASYLGPNSSRLIDTPQDIDPLWFKQGIERVGLTSGASVLDNYTKNILRWFQQKGVNLTFMIGKEKDTTFKLPEEQITLLEKYLSEKYEN